MALIKAVVRELFPVSKDFFGGMPFDSVRDAAVDEFFAMFLDFGFFLFGDDFPEHVGFGRGIAPEFLRGEHDLFLVNGDPEGFLENRNHFFMQIGRLLLSVHAGDVGGNEVHRSGAVKRDHGDNMAEFMGLHFDNIPCHSRAFQLEDSGGMPFADVLVGFGVVRGNIGQRQLAAVAFFDHGAAALHDRQGR